MLSEAQLDNLTTALDVQVLSGEVSLDYFTEKLSSLEVSGQTELREALLEVLERQSCGRLSTTWSRFVEKPTVILDVKETSSRRSSAAMQT